MAHLIQNRTSAFGRRGSFWHQNLSSEDVPTARALTRNTGNSWQVVSKLNRVLNWASRYDLSIFHDYAWRLQEKDIITLGPDLNQRIIQKFGDAAGSLRIIVSRPLDYKTGLEAFAPLTTEPDDASNTFILQTENYKTILFPCGPDEVSWRFSNDMLQTSFLLPIPGNKAMPETIKLPDRLLVVGIDFEVGEGFLKFNEDPRDIFKEGWVFAKVGTAYEKPYMSYTLQADNMRSQGNHIANYFRYNQSVHALSLAAAEYAGIAVSPWDAEILNVVPSCGVVRYTTDKGLLTAHHPHTPLPVGYMLSKDEIIGQGLRLVSKGDALGPGPWHRQLDWSQGLSLDGLCPFAGLSLPDAPALARAYAYNAEHDDYHVSITLAGPAALAAAFWDRVRRVEEASGKFLNAAFGFSALEQSQNINPVDFYFQHLLTNRAIAVEVDDTETGVEQKRLVLEFILAHKPVGSILLTRDLTPADSGDSGVWIAISDKELLGAWDNAAFQYSEF